LDYFHRPLQKHFADIMNYGFEILEFVELRDSDYEKQKTALHLITIVSKNFNA